MKTQKNLKIEWKEVELGKTIKLRGGFAFKSNDFVNQGVPLVRISNFNNKEVDLKNSVFISKEIYYEFPELHLNENDLLIAMSGATTGKVGVITKDNLPCLLNQRVGKFEIKDKNLDWRYLFLFIKSKNFQDKVFSIAGGCAQPNISGRQIESIKIPLPSLPDGKPDLTTQKQIVAVLEKAEKLKQKNKKVLEHYDEYLKSVFYEMFLSHRDDPKGPKEKGKWEEVELGNLCELITKGTTPTTYGHKYQTKGIPFLKVENISNGKINSKVNSKCINEETHEFLKRSKLKKNDVLFTIAGAIGRSAIFDSDDEANINQAIAIIRLKGGISPIFISNLLNSKSILSQIQGAIVQVAQANLSLTQVRKIKIPLPPLPLQQKFANIVEKVERLKEKQKKSLEDSEELFNVLMQRAFKGELEE